MTSAPLSANPSCDPDVASPLCIPTPVTPCSFDAPAFPRCPDQGPCWRSDPSTHSAMCVERHFDKSGKRNRGTSTSTVDHRRRRTRSGAPWPDRPGPGERPLVSPRSDGDPHAAPRLLTHHLPFHIRKSPYEHTWQRRGTRHLGEHMWRTSTHCLPAHHHVLPRRLRGAVWA